MTKTIFLIGFMGVGKSSLGKKLANKLKVPFLDTDDLLEQKFDVSIAEYFSKYGESAFRNAEKQLLQEYDFGKAVVATGGGLPCFYENMKIMNDKGITIFLNRPAKELKQRLIHAKKQRPLIKELSDSELLLFIEEKLNERLPFYLKSQITLNRDSQTIDQIISCLSEID
ncbi:MAG: shikimate kinase [Fluviicola sp.]|nr:MAG: shikimate kinase [Fluviicola sp.]